MPPYSLRPAGSADIEMLTAMLEKLFAIEEDFQFSRNLQHQGLDLLLNSPAATIIVAENDTTICGMVTGQLLISTAEGAYSLLIEDLFVEQVARGKGLGKRLLAELGNWGAQHGARRMQLLADKNNRSGLDFYDHTGWQPTQLICLRRYHHGERL